MESRKARPRFADVARADIGSLTTSFRGDEGRSSLVYRMLSRLLSEERGRGTYQMRIFYCPPAGLLRRPRAEAASDAVFLHELWLRRAWRERGPLARIRLAAGVVFLWPLVTVATALWFAGLHGRAVARRTGKGRLRQVGEAIRLSALHDVLPPWYYMFELFDPALGARAGSYLHRFETKGGLYRFVKHRDLAPGERTRLSDKLAFAAHCRARGVPTAPVLLAARDGAWLPGFGGTPPRLPEADLFVKQASGTGGSGAERWWYAGGGRHRNDDGLVLDADALLAAVLEGSRTAPCLVQPRLRNHPELEDLAHGALSTVRLMTVEDEHGGYEATHAVFRMALTPGKAVDNFHAGGLAASVDLRTGELGRATDVGLRPDVGWCENHPGTGAKIRGRRLPFWPETLELARRAHAAFPKRVVVGWDIAILETGPVVIEGNGAPDLDILQRCGRAPAGDSRLGALLAFHVRRRLAAGG